MNKKDILIDEQHDFSIAVIGLSCRFPEANNPGEFWDNLIGSKDSVRFFSVDELDANIDDRILQSACYVPASGYVDNIDQFDAEFFNFTHQEAQLLDPQFRLFFECAWEAFDDSGYYPKTLSEKVGVFCSAGMSLYAGNTMNDYFTTVTNHDSFVNVFEGPQVIIANKSEYLPTRVSYKFNLKGPSVNVQTACSSSLVAVHMACQSLLNGESDLALAGASAIHFPNKAGYLFSEGGIYASDGRCKAFSDEADGIVGGNGVGTVLLKRLKDAIKDQDNIHAIIRGSAINNDGANKVSYMAPSVQGQVNVLHQAYHVAGVAPSEVGFIETHGTGTYLGDPIEVAALNQVVRTYTEEKNYCPIGSVKTNIGHLDTAAGMAGLIKTILSLKNKAIPATLHFNHPNPSIDFNDSPFFVNTKPMPWSKKNSTRYAGVSAFGAGGTNAHAVLQEFDVEQPQCVNRRLVYLLAISAQTSSALTEYIQRFVDYLGDRCVNFDDFTYTINTSRSHYITKASFIFSCKASLISQLNNYIKYSGDNSLYVTDNRLKLVFLFSGQGSQSVNMGKLFYEHYAVFRHKFDECIELLKDECDIDIRSVMWGKESMLLDKTQYTQPALFVFEYALSALWQSWGLKPSLVMGHSVGEYVAACVAGVMSLKDSLRLIAARGRLMQELPDDGGMVAVFAPDTVIEPHLVGYSLVSIAAKNSCKNTVISGDSISLNKITDKLRKIGITCVSLQVSHAFHSPLMRPMLSAFREIAESIHYRPPGIPLVSNISGKHIKSTEIDAEYWIRHIISPVDFASSIDYLWLNDFRHYLEIGPKSTLIPMACDDVSKEKQGCWLSSCKQNDELTHLLTCLGKLFDHGYQVDWNGYYENKRYQKLSLPTYPFQRQRFWIDKKATAPLTSGCYKIVWQPTTIDFSSKISKTLYVILSNKKSEPQVVVESLAKKGHKILSINPESPFFIHHINSQFDMTNEEHWSFFIDHLQEIADNVIFIYIPITPDKSIDIDQATYCQDQVYPVYLNLLKLQDSGYANSITSLILLYPASLYENNYFSSPLLSPLIGMMRAAISESNQLQLKAIGYSDLPIDINDIVRCLEHSLPVAHVIIDGHSYQQPYLSHYRFSQLNELVIQPSNCYLITGGIGGLGMLFADYLVSKGATHVLLISRSKPNEKSQNKIDQLSSDGINVQHYCCDISNSAAVIDLFLWVKKKNIKIKGILHAAGVLDDRLLSQLDKVTLLKTMYPKINGAIELIKHIDMAQLDFFVNFSSIASVIGSPGQINYAASNAFLDSLTYYLASNGIAAKTINWGPWKDMGMTSGKGGFQHAHGAVKQLRSIDDKSGLVMLEQSLSDNSQQLIKTDFQNDASDVMERMSIEDFITYFWKEKTADNKRMKLNRSFSSEQISNIIIETTKKVVGDDVDIIAKSGFQDMGMDSMMGLQFRNQLSIEFGINLPSILIYQFNNIDELHDHLIVLLDQEQLQTNEIDNMSKQDIIQHLIEELG